MGELRRNVVTGRWSVVAPGRGELLPQRPAGSQAIPALDPTCPFCPGNEHELPSIRWTLPSSGDPGWQARAVPNRYPAFVPVPGDSGTSDGSVGPFTTTASATSAPALGVQEVLIETPRHDGDPATMSVDELDAALEAYLSRYRALQALDPESHTVVFRNRGPDAGRSLVHPHGQLVSIRSPVPEIAARETRLRSLADERGGCALCSLDTLEPDAAARTVGENGSFAALVPWAPTTTLELWVVPRAHQASFGQVDGAQRRDLAALLSTVLRAYASRAGDPSYNLIWHTGRSASAGARHLHWFLQLRPRVTLPAGFELATGVDICPSDPVRDADLLR